MTTFLSDLALTDANATVDAAELFHGVITMAPSVSRSLQMPDADAMVEYFTLQNQYMGVIAGPENGVTVAQAA